MIEEVIYDFWEKKLPEMKDREIEVNIKTDKINDIVGVRRAGKTFTMFNIIKRIRKKIGKKAPIYINFENRMLIPPKGEYFNDIIEFIHKEELLEKYKRVYLFLDEVQRVEGWEKYLRSIYDEFKSKIKIFVSGSSSSLLSKEYGKLLTGRHITKKIFPLSFKEFLNFKKFNFNKLTEKKRSLIKKYLKEYLHYGGFPEVVLEENKEDTLNQLFFDVLSRDVLSRVEVRKENVAEELSTFLLTNISNPISFGKISRYFKSRGIKISIQTLENYFYFMKDAFLFFDNQIFSYKIKDRLQYPRKVYVIDTGLFNTTSFKFSRDIGRVCENSVALELKRRYDKPFEIYYWKDSRGEVDFVIKKGTKIKKLVQVCYDIGSEETRDREIKSLIRASKELKCNNLLIISGSSREELELEGKKIKVTPLWKWLIE